MKDKLEREFDAYVTGVASFGAFVTLKEYFVEGLVPISIAGERLLRLRGEAAPASRALERQDVPARGLDPGQARRDRRGAPPPQLPPRGRGGRSARPGPRSAGASGRRRPRTGVRPPAARSPGLAMRRPLAAALALAATLLGREPAARRAGRIRTSGWRSRTTARTRRRARPGGGQAGGAVPTRLEVPPEVEAAYSGIKLALEGRLQRQGRRDRRSPRGRDAAAGSVPRRARRRFSAGLLDGRRRPDLRRRRAPEPGRPDHRLREGPGDLRRLDLHALPGRPPVHAPAVQAASSKAACRGPGSDAPAPFRVVVAGRPERRQVGALQPPLPPPPVDRPRPAGHDARRAGGGGARCPTGATYLLVDTGGYDPEGREKIPGGGAREGRRGDREGGPRPARHRRVGGRPAR